MKTILITLAIMAGSFGVAYAAAQTVPMIQFYEMKAQIDINQTSHQLVNVYKYHDADYGNTCYLASSVSPAYTQFSNFTLSCVNK